jgi:hypothetical protein
MTSPSILAPTSPLADPAGQSQLPSHLRDCAAARTRLHEVRGLLDQADGFLTPRFVSTLAVLAAAVGAIAWLVR